MNNVEETSSLALLRLLGVDDADEIGGKVVDHKEIDAVVDGHLEKKKHISVIRGPHNSALYIHMTSINSYLIYELLGGDSATYNTYQKYIYRKSE